MRLIRDKVRNVWVSMIEAIVWQRSLVSRRELVQTCMDLFGRECTVLYIVQVCLFFVPTAHS